MRLLLLLLLLSLYCVVVFCVSDSVFQSAKKLLQSKQSKFSKWFKKMIEQSGKKFCLVATALICSGCVKTMSEQIKPECPPMLREATYKAMQADEVSDYRIAVERCK